MTPEKKKQLSGSGRSPAYIILFGVVLFAALAGMAKIFIWPGAGDKAPAKDIYQPASHPGSRYRYLDWSGSRGGSEKAVQPTVPAPAGPPGMPRSSAPEFRTSQQINPREDPEGFVRQTFEESPWLWEKASPEDKEKIFEGYRQKTLKMMEMSKNNSSGTGMGMGRKIRELRWAGREKKGGRHANNRQINPVGQNDSNPGRERGPATPPGNAGGTWERQKGNPGDYNTGVSQGPGEQ